MQIRSRSGGWNDGLQGQNGHFGRTVDPDGNVNRSHPAADEDFGVLASASACNDRKLASSHGANPRQDDLSAMRVAAQDERHRKRRCLGETERVVRKEDYV